MSTDSSTASRAISAVKDTFSRIKKEGIDEQLFKDAKTSLVNNLIFSFLSNNANTATLLDSMQIDDRDINHINNYANIINDVQLEKVNKLASSLLPQLRISQRSKA